MAVVKSAAKGLTSEQVRAELLEAQRSGDLVAVGESGKKLNELFPGNYPAKTATVVTSREQVRAELREAQRTGDIASFSETGKKLNELFPGQYPKKS